MKKLITSLLVVSVVVTSLLASSQKRYDIKSAIIHYDIKGSGSTFGMSMEKSGKKKLVFKDWGALEFSHEKSSQKMIGNNEEINDMMKYDNGTVYTVDNDEKVIYKMKVSNLKDKKNISKMGKDMLKQMGGKKIGNGKVLGYNCEIWQAMGAKVWFYKGVPLKSEANVMGINDVTIATNVKFNTRVPNSMFKLPNYPIKTMAQAMNEARENPQANEQRDDSPSNEDIQKMMKSFGNMFGN